MITDAANNLADSILSLANKHFSTAKDRAVSYANTDDKGFKAAYQKHDEIGELLRKLYSEVCGHLHAVEAEMKKKTEENCKSKVEEKLHSDV